MEKYYCTECERNHYRGKIYQKHLCYKKKKESNSIMIKEINSLDLEKLRPVAQRLIGRLLIKMESTGNFELFIKRVYDIAGELKVPLIDERVYDKVNFSSKNSVATVIFKFEQDESVIRGFLGLADFFHTVAVKMKNKFYIANDSALFSLACS